MAAGQTEHYIGSELELFAEAKQWAAYVTAQLTPYLRGTVIEVGAGLGTRTRCLCSFSSRWIAVEPDLAMAQSLEKLVAELPDANLDVVNGTLESVGAGCLADTILYIDVLEHIEDDGRELEMAAQMLGPGGRIVVLAPAHSWLFSEFDTAVGHFRRYSLEGLCALRPAGLGVTNKRMLDLAGLVASTANRFLLKQSIPTVGQIRFWDSFLVRMSQWIDPVLGYRFGKSVMVVFEKPKTD